MTEVTSPDNIVKWTKDDPASIVQESQAQGDSIQAALSKRERFDFVWANSSERTAQTGMIQGSRGYQFDTKTEYLYDNSSWRIGLSYAEYDQGSAQSIPNITETSLTNLSVVSTATTDTTFVVVAAGGSITLVNPGVYSLSLVVGMSGGTGTTNYAAFRPDTTGSQPPLSLSSFNAGSSTVALPFLRTTISNYVLYPRMYQSSGASSSTLYVILRVGRLG